MNLNITNLNIKMEHIYIIFALIFGTLIVFLNGPFQSPDEYTHFYRSYQISDGKLISEIHEGKSGAYVPKSLVQSTLIQKSQSVISNRENKFTIRELLDSLNTKLDNNNKLFVQLPNTAAYSPLVYIPQSIAILIGKLLALSPLLLMYLGRIFNLIFSTIIIYFSIKNIPSKKSLIFLFALMPMLLYQSASLSADGFINCICIFTITYFIKLSIGKENIDNRQIITMFLLVILISLTKPVYFLITFLYFLIPKDKLKNNYYIIAISLILLTIVTNILWMKIANVQGNASGNSNIIPKDQFVFIIYHPLLYAKIIINTLVSNTVSYMQSFTGVLGWLDTPLPSYIVLSYFIMLFLAALNGDIKIKMKNKFILLLIFLFTVLVIITALYMTWTLVGGPIILGVQGRYFIPIALLFFLVFDYRKLNIKKLNIFLVLYVLFVLSRTLLLLYTRYFISPL